MELLEAEGPYSDPDHVTGNFLMDDKWTYSDDWQPGQVQAMMRCMNKLADMYTYNVTCNVINHKELIRGLKSVLYEMKNHYSPCPASQQV
jgi:hypothetical protein